MYSLNNLKFYCTKSINEKMYQNVLLKEQIDSCIGKFLQENWGETCKEDCEMNNKALKTGDRIVAKYNSVDGDIFIVADTVLNDSKKYEHATILFANEY